MAFTEHFRFLYNGGLDPAFADPSALRQRRTLSLCVFTLAPLGLLIMVSNYLYNAREDNLSNFLGLCLVFSSLYIQAYRNRPILAGNLCVLAYWMIPALLMLRHGMLSTLILWMLPIPSISMLLASRKSGVFWLLVCIATIWIITYLETHGIIRVAGVTSEHMQILLGQDAFTVYALETSIILVILTGATLVFRTMQMRAEEKLEANLESLRSEVHTRALAEQAATTSEQSKSNFLAVMSHELRTPLNGIVGAAGLLRSSKDEREQHEFMDVIQQSSENLIELINNVMDLSSLESGKLLLDNKVIELEGCIRTIAKPFSYQAGRKNIELSIAIADDLPQNIIGDPTRLKQILINLLGNALKFTDSGTIKIIGDCDYGKLRLQIIDTGAGIATAELKNLFDPYVQAGTDQEKRSAGSGLGLAIVKRLVNAMAGNIVVDSELGRGTTFTIYVPLKEAEVHLIDDEQQQSSKIGQLNALIADDNAVNCLVLSRILEKDNHNVVVVNTGREALEYVRSNAVDVVLMDIQMPEMNGLEATRAIRELDGECSGIPIIAISANISKEEETRALSAGMNAFVGKPFRYEDLMNKVGAAMNQGLH